MRHNRLATVCSAALALGALTSLSTPAQADLITDRAAFPTPETTIDFNQFTGNFVLTTGPVEVGDGAANSVTLTANQPTVIGTGYFDLSANGEWDINRGGFVGLARPGGAFTFTFNNSPSLRWEHSSTMPRM